MSTDWKVSRSEQTCAATGRPLAVGETYFSALSEEGDNFRRADYCTEAWAGLDKGNFFSFWKTKVQPPEEKRRLKIDVEAFYAFFTQLGEPEEPRKRLFRYLAALVLCRKRLLRLEGVEREPGGEVLLLHDTRAKQDLRVFSPPVGEADLAEAQETLNQIFECQLTESDF